LVFVEVIRLAIVLLATAAGYSVGRGPGDEQVIAAVLGACVGYVAGGVLGRLVRRAMGQVEQSVREMPGPRLFAGILGGVALGLLAALVAVPAGIFLPGRWWWPVVLAVIWTGTVEGCRLGAAKSRELLALAGLSSFTPEDARPAGSNAAVVDTSVVIDGRLLAVAKAGFLSTALLVPRFVLDELQGIADAAEPTRRRRGRRGLEVLDSLRELPGCTVHVIDDEVPGFDDVDAKLIALARRLGASLLTVDEPLRRSAEIQGVPCLDLGGLADSLRPVYVPGETFRLNLTRPGKELGQAVGFLDDGTMVVVSDGQACIGDEVDVQVTGGVRTTMGRMLFATLS
jgi:uncharacterized protein YacL